MRPDAEPLFGGRDLAMWVRDGYPAERAIPAYPARLRWHAFWFERTWRTQVARLEKASLRDDPVFIVGPWRSGTTAIHDVLATVTGWTTPQTWQCFNPSTCFLSRPPVDASTGRPMDQGRIRTRGPQEDEFALLLLGEPSLYRAFIDPRRLPTCAKEQWSTSNLLAPKRWLDFLQGITLPAPGVRLLLKSPSHTFRLPLLRTMFPRAKFIWMGRDPCELLPSNLKMWRAMTDRYALWGCPSGVLEDFLEDMIRACSAVLTQCLSDMPRESMLWVDFAELRADPRKVLKRVLRFLGPDSGLSPEGWARSLDNALMRFPIYGGAEAPVSGNDTTETLRKIMVTAQRRFSAAL